MSVRFQHIRGTTSEIESLTPLAAELGFDTTKKEPHIGDAVTAGGVRLAKKNIREIMIAAQITADTNDYNPSGMKHAATLVISTDAARDITGLVPSTVTDSTDGREITIYNGGSFNARLVDQSASSAAANRFDFGGQDLMLSPKRSATIRYRTQGGLNRWELVAQTIGSSVGAGAVIAMTLAASSQGFSLVNGVIAASVASGALTISIKTLAGNNPSALDPVYVLVRGGTLANGDYSVMSLVAATSIVVSSGSSLGMSNTTPFKIYLVGFNDGGTFRLGAIGVLPGEGGWPLLATDQLKSATAEGGAGGADSRNVFYANATVTSKPFAVLGILDFSSGLAAAGTWNIVPAKIQLYHAGIPLAEDVPANRLALSAMGPRVGMVNGKIAFPNLTGNLFPELQLPDGTSPTPENPILITFQSSDGSYIRRTVTAFLNTGIAGAMGTASGVAFRIWLVAIDTGSGVAIAAVNCLSGTSIMALHEGLTYSTVAGVAPNAQVLYSSGASYTGKNICILGYADYDAGQATAGVWATAPSRVVQFTAGMPLPGEEVQSVFSPTGAVATGTAASMPAADTVPAITNGDEYMTAAITPSSLANILEVASQASFAHNTAGTTVVGALFVNAVSAALAALRLYGPAAAGGHGLMVMETRARPAAGVNTFRTRIGSITGSGGIFTFNGSGGTRMLGGSSDSFMKVREIMA